MPWSSSNLSPQGIDVLSKTPAVQPPSGVVPNFETLENNQRPLIVVTSLLLALSSIFMLNRAYTKTFIIRKFSWDDRESTYHHTRADIVIDMDRSDITYRLCELLENSTQNETRIRGMMVVH